MAVSGQLQALVALLARVRAAGTHWAPEPVWTRWRREKKSHHCPYRESNIGRPARSIK